MLAAVGGAVQFLLARWFRTACECVPDAIA